MTAEELYEGYLWMYKNIYSFKNIFRRIPEKKDQRAAYLMFNLYTPPCFAALGAMNSEMKSAKWLWGAIALQLATGFTVGFLVYQIGTLITTGSLGAGFAGGLIAVIAFALVISGIIVSNRRKLVAEYQLKTN